MFDHNNHLEEFNIRIDNENAERARRIAFLGIVFWCFLAILDFVRFYNGELEDNLAQLLFGTHMVLGLSIIPFSVLSSNLKLIKQHEYRHASFWVIIVLVIIGCSLMPMNLFGIPYNRNTIIPFAVFIIVFNLVFTFSRRNIIIVNLICLCIMFATITYFKWDDLLVLVEMLIEILAMAFVPILFAIMRYNQVKEEFYREKLLIKKNKEIQQVNSELRNFAYVASHDLKEPLRMVNSYLNLLKMDLGQDITKRQEEFIYYATDGAKRMQRLMEDLLDYANIGQSKISENEINLNDILFIVVQNLKVKIETQNAFVESNLLPNVKGNASRLVQLFQNLISNSIKFREENRPINIKVAYEQFPNYHEICIEDNGIGIPANAQVEVFNLFQRLHHSKRDGSGIGLATCKKIMEQLGGSISLKSEEGVGTKFYLHFPKPIPIDAERISNNDNDKNNSGITIIKPA